MDPRHRDRVAYLRIVSGKFKRDMDAWHPRMKKKVRLARPMRLFGQDREVVDEAYGRRCGRPDQPRHVHDRRHDQSASDWRCSRRCRASSPSTSPCCRHARADRYKQFLKGLSQIEEEGAIQLFYPVSTGRREPIMAAVGALQFDVVRFRLEAEYNVETDHGDR